MNFIVNEHFDCIIEGSVRVDVDQVLHVMQHLWKVGDHYDDVHNIYDDDDDDDSVDNIYDDTSTQKSWTRKDDGQSDDDYDYDDSDNNNDDNDDDDDLPLQVLSLCSSSSSISRVGDL